LSALVGFLTFAACDASSLHGAERDNDAVGRGAGLASMAPAARAEQLSVALHAERTLLCPGECTTLTAVVQGGVTPYALAWSNEALSGPGPHAVCIADAPLTTTLAVSDSARSAEFEAPANAGAALTLSLRDDCAVEEPPMPACPALSIALDKGPDDYGWLMGTADVDRLGNLYVAGDLAGAAQLDANTRADSRLKYPALGQRVFLAKYNPRCALVWWRWLGEEDSMTALGAMDVDPSGQVAITSVALGSGYTESSGGDATSEYTLWSIDSAGDTTFSIHSQRDHFMPAGVNARGQLRWGDDGSLAVLGLSDLCVAQDPLLLEDGMCVARIARSGEPIFARAIGHAYGAGVHLDAQGGLLAAGLSYTGDVHVTGIASAHPNERLGAFAVRFDPAGLPLWLRSRSAGTTADGSNWTQGYAQLTPAGDAQAVWTSGSDVTIWSLDALGNELGLHTFASPQWVALAPAPDGSLATAAREPATPTTLVDGSVVALRDRTGLVLGQRSIAHDAFGEVQDLHVSSGSYVSTSSRFGVAYTPSGIEVRTLAGPL
jgi:hypothetical protein